MVKVYFEKVIFDNFKTLCYLNSDNKFTIQDTVFPQIVSAETILFWKLECGNYSREETIQGGKLFFSYFSE